MAKKKTAAKAPKTKAASKAAQSAAKAKNVQTSPRGETSKGKTPDVPAWLKPFPVDYIVATEDYRAIILDHNEKFDTAYNQWKVQPAVFFSIHSTIWKHYHGKSE